MVLQFSECEPDLLARDLLDPALCYLVYDEVAKRLQDSLVNAMQALDINHNDPEPQPDVRRACVDGKLTFGG